MTTSHTALAHGYRGAVSGSGTVIVPQQFAQEPLAPDTTEFSFIRDHWGVSGRDRERSIAQSLMRSIPDVIAGVKFINGEKPERHAA